MAGATAVPAMAGRRAADGAVPAALERIAAAAAFGVLAEVRDDARVWRGSRGVARLGTRQPVPAGGRFRIGSITKTFVATVVLQLAGEGRLGLDDPLRRWAPGILPDDDRITVRHLLQHTSGLENLTNAPAFRALYAPDIAAMRDRTWTARELIAFGAQLPRRFEPGAGWAYANTGYVLLGMVVERVTGNSYGAEIRRRILRPLGMRHTRVPGTDPHLDGPHPHGYVPVAGEPVDVTVYNPSLSGAAGEMTSTAADLNTFLSALIRGRLLAPDEQRAMLTAHGTPRDYEYGLGVKTRVTAAGIRLWGHRGDFFGYAAESWTTGDGRRQLTVAYTPSADLRPADVTGPLVTAVFG
ncbi:serine hydrolase domain-containing protein [Actinoplanes sp. NPDC049802]|uniref:serine hydrolase domain-containing protein n=1 Tax=Actinoplanes sp. NPDC049802 TaxID=3154742 RepID=UPI0033EEF0D2